MFRRLVSLAAVIALSTQASLATTQVRPSGLIDTREIPKYGLHRDWFTQLPIDSSIDSLEKIFVYDSKVYAQTESGMLVALDGESGELIWATQIGVPYRSHSKPTFSEKYVALIGGSTLYVLNRDDGIIAWSRPHSSTQGLGATIVADHVYVSDSDSLMHAYSMAEEDQGSSGLYFTSLGKPVTAPVAGVKTVSWTNDRGDLLIADSLQQGTGIQVQLTSTVIAPLDN